MQIRSEALFLGPASDHFLWQWLPFSKQQCSGVPIFQRPPQGSAGYENGRPKKEGAMLVITRKVGESIVIDETIRVTLVSLQGGKVRLGIEAPTYITVDREEVHERKARELVACGHK
jgi:carbon storage regulator